MVMRGGNGAEEKNSVYIAADEYANGICPTWRHSSPNALERMAAGAWNGFIEGAKWAQSITATRVCPECLRNGTGNVDL